MALTVAELRQHVTTSLVDDALGRLLNDAYSAIAGELGAEGQVTVSLRAGSGPLLLLPRTAGSIVSVTENAQGPSATTLAADDYDLRPSGDLLERRNDGTNPAWRWHGRVDVVLVSVDDSAERDRAAIALVALELDFPQGGSSERLGDWAETTATGPGTGYEERRAAILASLHPADAFAVH